MKKILALTMLAATVSAVQFSEQKKNSASIIFYEDGRVKFDGVVIRNKFDAAKLLRREAKKKEMAGFRGLMNALANEYERSCP